MNIAAAILVPVLLFVLALVSYVDRIYSEMGKFLTREFQENLDAWEELVEPKIGLSRDHLAISAAVLSQLSLACLTLLFGMLLFERNSAADKVTFPEVAQAVLGVVLVIVLFNRLVPYVLFVRTRGLWVGRLRWLLRLLFYLVLPVTFFMGFLSSIAALAEAPKQPEEDAASEAVDALIEAGEEEGILEESDRDLVRSAVEFGDKVVREVMTPRPEMIAISAKSTLEELLNLIEQHPVSRVPVYDGSLDQITGIAFAHDLLRIPDEVARVRTVASIQRPAAFVPETKKVNELLREMQREKQHMRIVIDEYGGVAGLVTIEDLLEEIVGSIADEHETDELESPRREPDGSWLVPGSLELARIKELFGDDWAVPEGYEATTVGGLVSEIAGRIPLAGEVVEEEGLRFEVLSSTDRLIERLRISRMQPA
ncbi:hemolysin family protein [Pseudacidobacterium ailaaui]|jgi:CBS domain containing-hemolysin-like protein|uniref:hemolysin family protein n=1 Tax=Pseudacidobacterium ailaaui TaxID=1382359 RepID=UPI00047AC341|nr:hemolysin family protein [Pseudacidobacterium ailaaui]MBX6359484.1 HlyC/CorC family transporter [Pseudacidobacterium ailaaui]